MWFLICIKTGTELLPTLNNLENDGKVSASCKGPSAWWRIRAYAIGANLSRVQALNGRVYGPERVSSEEHLQYELDCWEADVREYEIIQGRDVDELSKRGGLLQLIPKKMADAIEDNPMATTFEQARNYVRRQIDLKRAAWTRGGASKHQKPKDPNLGNLDGQAHQHYPPNEHYDQWGGHSDQEEGGEANSFKGGGGQRQIRGCLRLLWSEESSVEAVPQVVRGSILWPGGPVAQSRVWRQVEPEGRRQRRQAGRQGHWRLLQGRRIQGRQGLQWRMEQQRQQWRMEQQREGERRLATFAEAPESSRHSISSSSWLRLHAMEPSSSR